MSTRAQELIGRAKVNSMTVNSASLTEDTLKEELPVEVLQQQQQEETNAQVAGATGILALGNILSRVLGLIRETVLTFLFGATSAVDALQVAIIVPKAIYDLLIGGHINGAIVPVLSEIVTVKGKDELWRVVSILLSVVVTLLSGLVILIILLAPQVVAVVAGGADFQTRLLATNLLRLTAPALIFMGLFAIFSGTLFALRSFALPAFAGVVFNGGIVIMTLALAPPLQLIPALNARDALDIAYARPTEGIQVVALGWVIGAIAQMLLQLPGLRHSNLRLTLNWRHPALRSIVLLYAPVMFSLIMDTLVIRPFSYNLASQTGEGSIAYMNWATTLIQFPQGLVATAISVAILPTLAGQAVMRNGITAFKNTLGLGLRLATTLIIPATVGLYLLSVPIIALLFEHGAFTAADTVTTAIALRLYLIGLPFAAIDLLLVYAFYARKDTLTPALIGVLSLVVYMVTAILLLDRFGLFSLMIADSVKHITHATVSAVLLSQRLEGYGEQRFASTLGKTAFAALIMAVVGYFALPILTSIIGTQGFIREALLVIAGGVICGGTFLAMAAILRLQELYWLSGLIKRKFVR